MAASTVQTWAACSCSSRPATFAPTLPPPRRAPFTSLTAIAMRSADDSFGGCAIGSTSMTRDVTARRVRQAHPGVVSPPSPPRARRRARCTFLPWAP